MQRTKHTVEFKAEVVKQVVGEGHFLVDVADQLGLSEGMLYTWVRKSKAADGTPTGTCEHCKLSRSSSKLNCDPRLRIETS